MLSWLLGGRRKRPVQQGKFARLWRRLRWVVRLLLLLLLVDLFLLYTEWPDWQRLAKGPIPKSNFIQMYEKQRRAQSWPRLRWQPVRYTDLPRHMVRAVIVAEDSRFYRHGGFDLEAFREAMNYNLNEQRFAFGASTISQQTVKNLFLSGSRNPLRKWHELLLTWGMERNLSKRRILELYLNIAEFGLGVYGVEAAGRHYWGISASQLSLEQAAELAATLPSPKKHNPSTRTRRFLQRTEKIRYWLD